MVLDIITSPRLKECLSKSARFLAIPENEQAGYINRMNQLSPESLDQLCQVLEEENIKEQMDLEAKKNSQVALLNQFLEELQGMILDLQKSILAKSEEISRANDQKTIDELLKQLET